MSEQCVIEKRIEDPQERGESLPEFVPAADIFEKESGFLIRCEMPGVWEENLEIIYEDHVLTLVGQQNDAEEQGFDCLGSEFATGIYRRSFTVSQPVDADHIKARLKDGVLNVDIPKAKQSLAKRIAVEV